MPAANDSEPADIKERVRKHYREQLDPTHQALMLAWVAFGLTFGVVRGITYGIRDHWLPIGNISTGGLHIHHYVWGIAILMLVGVCSIVDNDGTYTRWFGVAYGIGCALIVDEFALLLNLEDVYWAEQGRWSVDVAFGVLAVAGIYFTSRKFWSVLVHEFGPKRRK